MGNHGISNEKSSNKCISMLKDTFAPQIPFHILSSVYEAYFCKQIIFFFRNYAMHIVFDTPNQALHDK